MGTLGEEMTDPQCSIPPLQATGLAKNHNHDSHLYSLKMMMRPAHVGLIIVTILFPPTPVVIATTLGAGTGRDLFTSVSLTLLGYLPGLIHAAYFAARKIGEEYYWEPPRRRRLSHETCG
ncbi:hypothetical protein BDV93DRAFT_524422 [Ceratobasidium sp. AG-I]|nr:hypothetical protein BDV93DRAFT_524422 [Ceratobasidium sp. AG-I]